MLVRPIVCCLIASLAACGSDPDTPPASPALTTPLELAGLRVSLPDGFAPVSAAEQAELMPPGASAHNLQLVAHQRADRSVKIVLQNERAPLVAVGGERVEDYLGEVVSELLGPQAVGASSPQTRDHGIERCLEMHDGQGHDVSSCIHTYISGSEIIIRIVTCFAEPAQRAVCESIMDSRALDTTSPAPLTATLERTASPGLPDIGADTLGWIRFGMSRDDFHAACRDAGERHDMPLPPEPAIVHAWFRDGRMAQCSGFGAPLSVGEVSKVHAMFHGDRLTEASLFVAAPYASVSARIRSAYPDFIPNRDSTTHYIDRDAVGRTILGLTASPSMSRPGTSLLVVQSRAALDAPPL